MSAHQTETVKEGLFMAAKGGCNGEFHNHNDVGTFIIYKNGERFICDSGNKTYNALTFSDKRYESRRWLWAETVWRNLRAKFGEDFEQEIVCGQ